jgi:hypothetical protein
MELAGDEKKIQALFSELSLADAQDAPRFEKLWREDLRAHRQPRFGKPLVVIAATLLVAMGVLFVAWRGYKSNAQQNAQTIAPQNSAPQNSAPQQFVTPREPDVREPDKTALVNRPTYAPTNRRRTLARRRQAERALQQQAAMLASWKSPTANFMTSPIRSKFNSLPQLDQSVKDLQSFLPKESNQ